MRATIHAAHERASFDMVSEMLRQENRQGLKQKGRYQGKELDQLVKEVVNIGHQGRHEALIKIVEWSTVRVSDFIFMSVSNIPKGQEF